MASCVSARLPATSTMLIVTGLFGSAGTCAIAAVDPSASAEIAAPVIRRSVWRRSSPGHFLLLLIAVPPSVVDDRSQMRVKAIAGTNVSLEGPRRDETHARAFTCRP